MGISKFNAGNKRIDWGVNTEGWEIKKLRTLTPYTVYPLKGMFTTPNTGFGEGAILISDGYLVGIPGRYADLIKDMLADTETVGLIQAGVCGFEYSIFKSEKFGRDGFRVEFVDL